MMRLFAELQSTAKTSPSWAFHCVGFNEGCRGLTIRVFPLAYSTWSESGDQQPEYTGVPEGKSRDLYEVM